MPIKGFKHSEESKRKISESCKGEKSSNFGKHLSEETRKKLSESLRGEKNPNYGKHPSNETRKKNSDSHKGEKNPLYGRVGKSNPNYGKTPSEETRRKISESLKKFFKENYLGERKTCSTERKQRCSEETRRKIGIANTGKRHSEETKRKMSESRKGRVISNETRLKISIANSGKCRSIETKKKLSDIHRGKHRGEKNSMYGRTGEKSPMYGRTGERSPAYGLRGELSPAWKGGISFAPYCPKFNNEFKTRVRAFFDNKCVLCGKTKEENGKNLSVHHVNYDKMVCCNENEPIFACLCVSCHTKTNHNRECLREIIEKKINEEYNGKSFYTKEEYVRILSSVIQVSFECGCVPIMLENT